MFINRVDFIKTPTAALSKEAQVSTVCVCVLHVVCVECVEGDIHNPTVYLICTCKCTCSGMFFLVHEYRYVFQLVLQEIVQHLNIEKVLPSYRYSITTRSWPQLHEFVKILYNTRL